MDKPPQFAPLKNGEKHRAQREGGRQHEAALGVEGKERANRNGKRNKRVHGGGGIAPGITMTAPRSGCSPVPGVFVFRSFGISQLALQRRSLHIHCLHNKMEVQRGQVTCLRSHSMRVVVSRFRCRTLCL